MGDGGVYERDNKPCPDYRPSSGQLMDIKCPFNRVAAESVRISSEALTLFHMKHDDSFRSEKTS